jgi:HOOK domain
LLLERVFRGFFLFLSFFSFLFFFFSLSSPIPIPLFLRAPKYFDPENIKRDLEDNWILKSNNIKKIVATLDKLYQMELGIHYGIDIDANSIARDQNTQEIVKLVELVLGVMVESEHKNEYIGSIMQLDETTQRELMVILEGV